VAPFSPNDGHTIAIKDNIVTTDLPTSCASNILRGYVAPERATVVRLLEEAGMLVLGKTNMDEFGMGSHSLNSAFGPVTNGRLSSAVSVGGSSGGSALAVAANLCHFAIGTDTGGSVRLPAAYLNLVGFKPSYGLISRYGVVPYANSLDTVGIFGKSCLDIFLLFKILSEPDPKDPTCLDLPTRRRIQLMKRERLSARRGDNVSVDAGPNTRPLRDEDVKHKPVKSKVLGFMGPIDYRRRIGVPVEYNIKEMHPDVRAAWVRTLSMLTTLGHDIVPVSLPSTKQALSAYYVLAPAEASSNLAKYDGVRYGSARSDASGDENGVLYSGHRGDNFGDEVRRRILLGSFSLSAGAMDNYFIQAQKVRRVVQNDFNMVFKLAHPLLENAQAVSNGVDFILCPTAPTFPPSLKSLDETTPLETYINDVFTVPASLAGLPAISVPAAAHHNEIANSPERAIGIQIIGQYGDDFAVIQFAKRMIEGRQKWLRLRRLVGRSGAIR
jgi:aspartyl-tRNA(Asn)/glutamyl-tRNA(Gln) amidotransferase subunit A